MAKLKVGLFIDTFFPMVDGVIMVVDNYARRLSKDFDVTVFAPVGRKPFDDSTLPYKVVRCKSKFPIFFLDYDLPLPNKDKEFKKQLNESNLDIVYIHSPFSIGKAGVKYAKKNGIPVVCHLHSQFKKDFYKSTHSKTLTSILLKNIISVFNKCDYAIAVNEFTKSLFINEYKLKIPTTTIYNATEMSPVKDTQKAIKFANNNYNLSKDEKIFLYVGRINKLKNIEISFKALAILKEKFNNFKFLLVGDGCDIEYYKSKTKKLKLTQNVIFTGKILDKEILKALYIRADLFLFPSKYDTEGLVKLEAASQKTPTICLENTGASSSIIDNETGFISKDDPKAFADKIYMAITDEKLYDHVSEKVFTDLYRTWEQSSKEMQDFIIKVIEEKRERKENGKKNRI